MRRSQGHRVVVEQVRIRDIRFDERINRHVAPGKVKKITEEFNPLGLGTAVVSAQADGIFLCLDGQHRILGAKNHWGENGRVRCEVHHGLTREEEAAMIGLLNDRTGMRAYDRFKANLEARDKTACGIADCLAEAGLRASDVTGDGNVTAISSVETIYKLGDEILRVTLALATSSWGIKASAVQGDVLLGLGRVVHRYWSLIDLKALGRRLASHAGAADGVLGRGREYRGLHGGTVANGVASYVVDQYNKGRRGGGLAPWWK